MKPWEVVSVGLIVVEGLRLDKRVVVPEVREVAKRVG
jgi:hypothetical protein